MQGQMEKTSDSRAYGLGVVDIDGVPADQDRISAKRIGTSDHRAEVARIANLITEHHQPRRARQRLMAGTSTI